MWSIAICLTLFSVTGGAPPPELDSIPANLRNQATVILTGTYSMGRSPCIPRGNGVLAWYLEFIFRVDTVVRGNVALHENGTREVLVNQAMLPKSDYVVPEWEEGKTYLLLLKPSEASTKVLDDPKGFFTFRTALESDEIVAIVGPIGKTP